MEFKLIDFSEVYYRNIAKVRLPASKGGRFIQLRNEEREIEYIVLSPQELSVRHANIVERFCILNGIEGSYNPRKDHFHIQDSEWVVVGGGFWRTDNEKRELDLYGKSTMYGKFDPKGLKKNVLATKEMQGYCVRIDGIE
jgi:hypothetical protein